MGQISLQIPQVGLPDSTEGPKIATDMTTIQTAINGNLDGSNLTAATAQSAAVNQDAQTVKGAVNIATSQSRTNAAYGLLATPDQVTGIVLPSNGLIAVWYQATWSSSVSAAGIAAIFLGANQLQVAGGASNPSVQAAATTTTALSVLTSGQFGLGSLNAAGYVGDVTTGQVVGSTGNAGPCYIFAAAGTYTVSVQFRAPSGSVTALNRKLWVQALSFA